jgi:hypothetical protein
MMLMQNMKWVAIVGSWQHSAPTIEVDVRRVVQEIVLRGDGVIVGGAPGVDYIATDEYMKVDPTASRLKILLPSTLEKYALHYSRLIEEGEVIPEVGESLITQLQRVRLANQDALVEDLDNEVLNDVAYFKRIEEIVDASDELQAFRIDSSKGTQHAIDKAHEKGIPTKVYVYKASN